MAGRVFSAQEYWAKGYFGFGMHVGSGTKWVAERLLWVPRRDAGVGVVQASLHHPSVVGQKYLYLAVWDMTSGRLGTLQIPLKVVSEPKQPKY